ncbi:hypothetical protein DL762_000044 [Monosporascus cannonballus]|uniref:lytic cellulose monooxygenase (C4-dehydrogenating) n=1 Tax=Monosporascus cannonballus TaxID=155416 RepID=A0ABY0HLN4_9PEZI|nr:hypothetical protein DL763_005187 [Monosporascus cannonballus]RYO95482.1 hypothetical protein DL762_000044 [Monosporascus cannonballus]
MKSFTLALTASALATAVFGHATFQQLWVEGEDQGGTCVRLPPSNSPVTSVTGQSIVCNANPSPAQGTCDVPAGSTVTVEMHQQPGDRSCANEGIGGNHFGPVVVYLSKVDDAAAADGSTPWFKIFESGYDAATGKWGNDVINEECGKQDVVIPSDIAPGDYLLRAETIALHTASQPGGAQFYMSCYQITVTGSGSATPEGVSFPGAYSANDPGILVDIWGNLESYTIPGPPVYTGA